MNGSITRQNIRSYPISRLRQCVVGPGPFPINRFLFICLLLSFLFFYQCAPLPRNNLEYARARARVRGGKEHPYLTITFPLPDVAGHGPYRVFTCVHVMDIIQIVYTHHVPVASRRRIHVVRSTGREREGKTWRNLVLYGGKTIVQVRFVAETEFLVC